jgi:hypothetical protein
MSTTARRRGDGVWVYTIDESSANSSDEPDELAEVDSVYIPTNLSGGLDPAALGGDPGEADYGDYLEDKRQARIGLRRGEATSLTFVPPGTDRADEIIRALKRIEDPW